jgi:anaerobic selenocysteine-containing dehydrogenase
MTAKTSCKFCAGRCGMIIHHKENKIERIEGNPDHPVSRGWTCARGRAATAKYHKNRLDE